MKYTIKLSIVLLAAATVLSSCRQEDPGMGFSISTDLITMGAEGGTDVVKIKSDAKWIATTESPWIMVSPANGRGNVDCRIKVDSTLYNTQQPLREGSITFMSTELGKELNLRIKQTGFDKMIVLSETELNVPEYGAFGKRSFEVEVTSNVEFQIDIPDSVKWLGYKKYNFELDRGSRPRTVKLNFTWDNNTRPWDRLAQIAFVPKGTDKDVRNDTLRIIQTRATKIEDNREGDSLAIIACMRSLNGYMGKNAGESMSNWNFVTLWEPTDKDVTPDKLGRVRSVLFYSLNTSEGVPYEIQFLTKAEEIRFYSNGNAFMKDFGTGDEIAKLTELKRLQFFSFGLSRIDDSFANLSKLTTLDLFGNNFNKVPEVLTPDNFPEMRQLDLGANRRWILFDMQTTTREYDQWGGFRGEFPERLLQWDSLQYLSLSNNYIWGKVPDMMSYEKTYSEEDRLRDTLPARLVGKPKVLPVIKKFRINLNLLNGELPEWLLYHPNLMEWDPAILVFNQDFNIFDRDGNRAGFSNVPDDPEYYYEAYPHKRP